MVSATAASMSMPAAGMFTSSPNSARAQIPAAWEGFRSAPAAPAVSVRRSMVAQGRRSMAVRAEGGERQPWDFGRFVKTLVYFNEPPPPQEILKNIVMAPFNLVSAALGGTLEDKKNVAITVLAPNITGDAPSASGAGAGAIRGTVLVTGATGGVGKRVVDLLLKRGFRVRAMVRDVEKARTMLGSPSTGALEIVAADVTQKATLLPEYFEGVRAVVNCCAVKVQPKEGDTVDREKYYQGIKFYDPEIANDTPESVELVGVNNLLDGVRDSTGVRDGQVVFAVAGSGEPIGNEWGPLDDVVMGGVSKSAMRMDGAQGAGLFVGDISTENNGGFASVRTKNYEPALDLGAYDGLDVSLKGNGNRLKFILRTDTNWDGIAYCLSVDTSGDQETLRLPFKDFFPVFRAKRTSDAPALDPTSIRSIQIMCSKFEYDGDLNPNFTPGPFEIPISEIKAYMPEEQPARFVHVGSAGATRWNRPGIVVEKEPPAVGMNEMLGGLLTFKLAGEDAVRASGVPFTIIRPCALTEEPRGAELQFDQGDVITGKVSRDDIAELAVACLEQSSAVDTTFEVKSTVPFSTPWKIDEANPPPPREWAAELAAANLRKGVTGKTVDGVYTGKQVEAEATKQTA